MQRKMYLLALAAVLAFMGIASAATIHVPGDQPTISAGINAAADGDTVSVAPGSYSGNITVNSKAVVVMSTSGPNVTGIGAGNSDVFCLNSVQTFNGFQLIGFRLTVGSGGRGLAAQDSRFRLENCAFEGPAVRYIHFSGATSAGSIQNCTFYGGSPPVSDGILLDNYATLTLSRCLFNQVSTCVTDGSNSGTHMIVNNTFVGGNVGIQSNGGRVTARNNIITGFTGYGVGGTFYSLDYNDVWSNTLNYDGLLGPGPHDISQDPRFQDAGSNVFTIRFDSPCHDAGDPNPLYNDPDGSRSDIGAYPYIPRAIRVPGDQSTIQAGINAATDGDSVLVAPGVYVEHLDFLGKAVSVVAAAGPESTTVKGFVPGVAVVQFVNNEGPASRITGMTITGGGSGSYSGIYCLDASPTINGNVVRGNSGTAIHIGTGSDHPILKNNTVTNNGEDGVYLDCGFGGITVLKNNIISNNAGIGIHRRCSYSALLEYNDVYTNGGGNYYGVAPGTGSISSNPQFCDSSIQNYTLSSGSPCVGTGEGGANMGALGVGCITPPPEQPTVQQIAIGSSSDSLHVIDNVPILSWKYFDQQSRPHTKSEVEVGTDNNWTIAEMWQPATIVGPDTSIQYAGLPLVDGATYYVRVRVFNDTLWSLWKVAPFRMNSVPSAPTPLFPNPEQIVLTGRPTLVVMNAIDAEGDTKHYDFEVYRDSALTQLASYFTGKVEGISQTSWKTDSLTAENQRHWWRARASDGYENGPWSTVQTFWVDAYNQPPGVFTLLVPSAGAVIFDPTPTFSWNAAIDPDPGASLSYTLTLGLDSLFIFHSDVGGIATTSYHWPNPLSTGINYYWEVRADDSRGGTATSATRSFRVSPPCDCPKQGDVDGNGYVDVQDVLAVIRIAFVNGADVHDSGCPKTRGDVNNSAVVDVNDVLYVIKTAFTNGPPPVNPCGP